MVISDRNCRVKYLSAFWFMSKVLFINVLPSLLDLTTDILNALAMIGVLNFFHLCDKEDGVLQIVSGVCEKTKEEKNFNAMPRKIAGAISLSMIFWPGIVMAVKMIALQIKNKDYKKIPHAIRYLPFPIYIIFVEARAFFHPNTRSYRQQLIQTLSMEAFYESFPQLVLQTITIIYGYPTNMIQLLSILFSFLVLTKTILLIDNQDEITKEITDGETDGDGWHGRLASLKITVQYNFWLFPLYISSVVYKVAVFSLTFAFFRIWSLLTMALLIIQMILLAKFIGFEDVYSWVYPVFNNFFLINIGGANMPNPSGSTAEDEEIRPFDEHSVEGEKEKTIERSYKFAKRSIIISFFHHTLILIIIAFLVLRYGEADGLISTEDQKTNSTSTDNFFSNEVLKTRKYWQEMRHELYPYNKKDDDICIAVQTEEFGMELEANKSMEAYTKLLDNCQLLERKIKIYHFLLIVVGVTVVGLFNLVLSIYSARDVNVRKTLENVSDESKTDKEIQTETNPSSTNREAKVKAFDNAFLVKDNKNPLKKRNSVCSFPVRTEDIIGVVFENSTACA